MHPVLVYFLGAIMGTITTVIIFRLLKKPIKLNGSLVIDRSDPDDGPYTFLELKDDIGTIEQNETVTFAVVSKNYISQK